MITDGMRHGRTVMYALVADEKYTTLRTLMELFQDMMPCTDKIRTFVMDKCAAQMKAVTQTFGCDILLCYFHVRQAVKRHVSISLRVVEYL